jgi:HAD superfamily hydrolase (TIGR01509 family)
MLKGADMNINPSNVILFDMDGVLIDTKYSVEKFWRQLSAEYGIILSPDDFENYIFGCTAKRTLDHLFPQLNDSETRDILKKLERFELDQIYSEIPGVTDFIKSIQARGFVCGLVTSAEPFKVNEVCGQLNIKGLFDKIVTSYDVTQGKPAPDCYLMAIQQFGKKSDTCIIFEDSVIGVQSAVAAYATCIGINQNSQMLLKHGAAAVFENFCNQDLHQLFNIE